MTKTTPPAATFARTVQGTGPGLVLAHGAGGSIQANFGPILDGLAAHHTVVGVDYPGSGDTPLPQAPLEVNHLADQLVAAAVAEGLDTVAITGWSLGGAVAIRAATRHPQRVQALVLTSAFARADARLALAATVWHDLYHTGDHALLLRYLMLVSRGTRALEAMTAHEREQAARAGARFVPAGTPAQTELVRRLDVRADLPRLRVPTLVIETTADPLVAPSLQRQLAASIPGARHQTLDTGHLAFLEDSQTWLDLTASFLQEHHNPSPARRTGRR